MQELPRRHEERIVLENAADDDQRMRAHDVNHSVSAEFRRVVGVVQGILAERQEPLRLVYGVASLPLGTPVELKVIFELAG